MFFSYNYFISNLPGGNIVYVLQLLAEEGPNTSLSWLLWGGLGFFFLMVVVGWLVSTQKSRGKSEVQDDAGASQQPADDLEILEGVGPKVAKMLNEAGIVTFADLARAKAAEIDKVLDAAGLQMMESTGWIDQAKLAARGDMEGLAKLQDELKGGRKA